MAGTTISVQRIWHKTLDSVNRAIIDPLYAFYTVLNNIITDLENLRVADGGAVFSSAGLVIKTAGSALAKNGTAFRFMTRLTAGVPAYNLVAANTDMAALSGTVTNAKFNVFVFAVAGDPSGTMTSYMGTEGATRRAVVFPTIPTSVVPIGFVEINPTGTGNFVGGTTPLDDATVVPNATFVNFIGKPTLGVAALASGLVAQSLSDKDNA
jgi:hypothetical protein